MLRLVSMTGCEKCLIVCAYYTQHDKLILKGWYKRRQWSSDYKRANCGSLLLVQRFPADGEIHGSEQPRLATFDESNPRRLEGVDDL